MASSRARVPRLALTRAEAAHALGAEAAHALGMSVDSFERYVQPDIRIVRRGRMRLVPVVELERWLDQNASLTLPDR